MKKYLFGFYTNKNDKEPTHIKIIEATSKSEAFYKAHEVAMETNTYYDYLENYKS